MLKKYLAGFAVLATLGVFRVPAQSRSVELDRGGEWLSWTPGQRATYIDGFLTGYLQGTDQACNVAQELFGDIKTYHLGDAQHPSDMPAARCLAKMETYSKVRFREATALNFSPYTEPITEFYTKHPEYRGIPFVNLVILLSDRNHKTADQLYQMALKGQIHEPS